MENYTLKTYSAKDHQFVYDTKKNLYQKYVKANWGEWNEEKQKEFFKKFIETYEKDIMIIMLNDEKIGFYHGNNIDDENYEICNVCIVKNHQNKGIGTSIIKSLINEHKNQNIHLQYFKQNPVVKLYEKLGFEKTEQTTTHIKMILKKQI